MDKNQAKFKLQFALLMLQVGRAEEAEIAFQEVLDWFGEGDKE